MIHIEDTLSTLFTEDGLDVFINNRYWLSPIYPLLTLSQTTNFRLFQSERICRRQFEKFNENGRNVLETGGKHCGKRRNCSLGAISPFPTVFSKGFYCRRVKTRACLGKSQEKS